MILDVTQGIKAKENIKKQKLGSSKATKKPRTPRSKALSEGG